ncbi:NXPE family member 3-like [Myripristis murdjan]|uniref:NXPE family member 3-like n=1 Tax=Myripristis murdjan TaxID=586833 RepID=UPI001175F6A4|nr:NXPE family member 3-like [Myripristis murdjan]
MASWNPECARNVYSEDVSGRDYEYRPGLKLGLQFQKKNTPTTPVPNHQHINCSYQQLSPEERRLLDSIAWPETPRFPVPISLKTTSDPAHSTFTILPVKAGGQWHVGDELEALIQIGDFQGRPKQFGGDFLVARLHDPELLAGVAGRVVDHLNGSYTAVFPLLWEGRAQVEVILVHPSEAITVLHRLNREHPGRIAFKSLFRSGSVSETTVCNVCLPPDQPLCNYTDLHTGEPWFCYKPRNLGCNTRINHFRGDIKGALMAKEDTLFLRGVNMKVFIRASRSNITVLPKEQDLKGFNLHSTKQCGPFIAVDIAQNIMVKFRCHAPPIRSYTVSSFDLRYIANELDSMAGGSNTVVVFSIWAHFGTYPVEVYMQRLQSIRRAVLQLLDRAPDTLVVIRTGNLKSLNLAVALSNSDWYSLQRDRVLRAMFKGLKVRLVDAWDMVLAHHLPHDLHPPPPIIKNMIDVLLSYICPPKK